jgi:hypothetical protein
MRALLACTALLCANAGPAFADDNCQTKGEKSAKALVLPSDIYTQLIWLTAVGGTASKIKLDPSLGCFRARMAVGPKLYDFTGETGEAVPRKAVAEEEGGSIVALVRFDPSSLKAFSLPVPTRSKETYMLVVQDADTLRVIRLVQGIPEDSVLMREFALALTSTGFITRSDLKTGKFDIGIGLSGR